MEKYGVVELTTDEMMDISGGLGLFDTTAWLLGAGVDRLLGGAGMVLALTIVEATIVLQLMLGIIPAK